MSCIVPSSWPTANSISCARHRPRQNVAAERQGDCVTVQLGSKLAEAEQRLIYATLDHCGGNKTMTAEVLGVSLKTLYNRLNEYQSKLFLQDAIIVRTASRDAINIDLNVHDAIHNDKNSGSR
jgi:DNA-binding NtrC family response regulator